MIALIVLSLVAFATAQAPNFADEVTKRVDAIEAKAVGLLTALSDHRLIARVDRLSVAYEKIFDKLFGQKQAEYSDLSKSSLSGYIQKHLLEKRVS
jgi:hypothetical protein